MEEIKLMTSLRSVGIDNVGVNAIKIFPFIQYWPDGLISVRSKMDFAYTVFSWVQDNSDNIEFRNLLVDTVRNKGKCKKSSSILRGYFREYCKENQLTYAI